MPEWLNEQSMDILRSKYLQTGESYDEAVDRISTHASQLLKKPSFKRSIAEVIHMGWLGLSSPIWANFGAERGLPISCYGMTVADSVDSIADKTKEVMVQTKLGGGTSGYFGWLRGRGDRINDGGFSNGSVSFMKIFDSRLLTELGLEEDFNIVLTTPIFKEREAMCQKITNNQTQITKLLLFTLIIENASLFSQFANILSFQRFRGQMKNVANIIAWTSIDEQTHADAGIYIIKELIKEGETLEYSELESFIDIEMKLIDWIYENGELPFFTAKDMKDYIKKRVDDALYKINGQKIYNIKNDNMRWFDEEVFADKLDDFFARRPVDYTKHIHSITEDDLF